MTLPAQGLSGAGTAPYLGSESNVEAHGMDLLRYAVVFLVIALIAALIGFTGIAAGAVEIAKILFFIFLVLAVASFVFGLMRRK